MVDNAFSTEPEPEEVFCKNHRIFYEGQEYTREQFLKAHFENYKRYPYKVQFQNDNVFWLGSSQRAKLQYHVLAQYFDLAEVSDKDKTDLEQFAKQHKAETAQIWHSRMKWEQGHEKLITFGAALDVRRADGTSRANGLYCYESKITDDKAEYKGVPMSWESWSNGIRFQIDCAHDIYRRLANYPEKQKVRVDKFLRYAMMAMFCQQIINESCYYLTLPKAEMDEIKKWIYQYLKDGKAAFPYQGEIPNADLNFTIDFKHDVQIIKQHDNTKHNQEIARTKVENTFSRLVGDVWVTQEIIGQGFNEKNIKRFVDYGLIERTSRGHYKRI